ncbi:MAG TPA: hypothetical protein VLU94_01265 [Candidatus Nitrosotalea sp.]|nr:hypothetical protein [Candidatus Nitrosotalea sp.]
MPQIDTTSRDSGAARSYAHRVMMAVFAVLIGVGLFSFWADRRGKSEWQQYKSRLEARGEKLDWRAWVPQPPPPDEENFAATPLLKAIGIRGRTDPVVEGRLKASPIHGLLGGIGDFQKGERTDLDAIQLALRNEAGSGLSLPSLPNNPASDILIALDSIKSDLNELRDAASRPYAVMRLNCPDPMSMETPNFVSLRDLSQILYLRATAELRLGRADEAFADVCVICRLADAANSSPTLIGAMIHCALDGLAVQAFWEGWVTGQWSDHQLEMFQKKFEKVNLLLAVDNAIRAERAFVNEIMENPPQGKISSVFGNGGNPWHSRLLDFGFRFGGLIQKNEITFNRLIDDSMLPNFDASAQRVFPQQCRENSARLGQELSHPTPFNYLATMATPNFSNALRVVARNQTSVNLAALACGLERYRRRHGQYPDTLESLVPDFSATLPHDLINGRPLKYHRVEEGSFLLYSIGWNEKDDGGFNDNDKGDWVWPSRAKK